MNLRYLFKRLLAPRYDTDGSCSFAREINRHLASQTLRGSGYQQMLSFQSFHLSNLSDYIFINSP